MRLIIQEKSGNGSEKLDEEMVAINDKILTYKCIPTIQHKNNSINLNPIKIMFGLIQTHEAVRSILKCAVHSLFNCVFISNWHS